MAVETLIGMALRRATSPESALKHEGETIAMLASLAETLDRNANKSSKNT